MLKSLCYSNSHEVGLCGGRIDNLYVEATVVLARYVLCFKIHVLTYVHLNTCVTWEGIDYKFPEDDTIRSKHVGV